MVYQEGINAIMPLHIKTSLISYESPESLFIFYTKIPTLLQFGQECWDMTAGGVYISFGQPTVGFTYSK